MWNCTCFNFLFALIFLFIPFKCLGYVVFCSYCFYFIGSSTIVFLLSRGDSAAKHVHYQAVIRKWLSSF